LHVFHPKSSSQYQDKKEYEAKRETNILSILRKKRPEYRDILLRAAIAREWDPKIHKKKKRRGSIKNRREQSKTKVKKSKQIRRRLTTLLPTPTLE